MEAIESEDENALEEGQVEEDDDDDDDANVPSKIEEEEETTGTEEDDPVHGPKQNFMALSNILNRARSEFGDVPHAGGADRRAGSSSLPRSPPKLPPQPPPPQIYQQLKHLPQQQSSFQFQQQYFMQHHHQQREQLHHDTPLSRVGPPHVSSLAQRPSIPRSPASILAEEALERAAESDVGVESEGNGSFGTNEDKRPDDGGGDRRLSGGSEEKDLRHPGSDDRRRDRRLSGGSDENDRRERQAMRAGEKVD